MIKYVVQIICEQETCGSGRGLKFNTCKEMGTASHSDPSLSSFLFLFSFQLQVSSFFSFLSSVDVQVYRRHLSDCARPIAALFKKQQQKETCEGLVPRPPPLPPSPPPSPPWQDS